MSRASTYRPLINEQYHFFPKCEHPILLESKNLQGFVPCGHCFACISKKRFEYYRRCLAESSLHKFNYFLTLTFSTLEDTSYNQWLKFLKRLQNKYSSTKIKYFLAYENGDKTNRPHFHCLLFCDVDLVQDYLFYKKNNKLNKTINEYFAEVFWRNGFVKFEQLTDSKQIRYLTSYCLKSYSYNSVTFNKKMSKSPLSNKFFIFRDNYVQFSKGLGFKYFDKNSKRILDNSLIINGFIFEPPRSWFQSRELKIDYPSDNFDLTKLKISQVVQAREKRRIYEISKKENIFPPF